MTTPLKCLLAGVMFVAIGGCAAVESPSDGATPSDGSALDVKAPLLPRRCFPDNQSSLRLGTVARRGNI